VLRSGQTFDEEIERALRAAKAVVVLWSPRSVSSRWVRAEATLADRGNKLVPVIIERCDLPIIFELTHAADLANWAGDTSDSRWQTLVSDLRRMVGDKEEAPKPAPAAKESIAPPLEVSSTAEKPSVDRTETDDLMLALARIAKKPRVPNLLEPTEQEEEMTQFFTSADAFRLQEGDTYHCLQRLDGELTETRRSHCKVELAGDKLRVTDLNSTNGTFVDNKRIDRTAMLPAGSTLRVGNVTFEHEVVPRAEAAGLAEPMRFANVLPQGAARVAKS
jgi:hypothetical protein